MIQVLLLVSGFTSEHVVLLYSWNVSLVSCWWESAHVRFKLWSVYYDFFYVMGLGANFAMREVAPSPNSYANCHCDIYQDI